MKDFSDIYTSQAPEILSGSSYFQPEFPKNNFKLGLKLGSSNKGSWRDKEEHLLHEDCNSDPCKGNVQDPPTVEISNG